MNKNREAKFFGGGATNIQDYPGTHIHDPRTRAARVQWHKYMDQRCRKSLLLRQRRKFMKPSYLVLRRMMKPGE